MPSFDHFETCRSILESLPTGMCVVDLQKRIVFWSDGAERVTGHLRYEVIGHSCVAEPLLHCDQPGCEFCHEDCPTALAIKTSQPAQTFGFVHHKSGYEVPVCIRAVPVRNQHGSVIGAVETFEALQQAASADHREDGLKLAGYVDEVTGLANRPRMQSHLRQTLATFAEVQVPFSVLGLRLEGLERFRASFGPEAASSLLRVVAHTLESTVWRTDSVGRWNDDQFLVILNDCHGDALHSVRDRIRRLLANDGIEWWGERRSLPVSVAVATPQPDDSVESLMARVQKSLDAASAWRAQSASASGGSPSPGS